MTDRLQDGTKAHRVAGWILLLLAIGVPLIGAYFAEIYFSQRMPPAQPIPFSHRIHAGTKQIGCLMCHARAHQSLDRIGIPPLETCMLCHRQIIIHYPYIEKLRAHYEQDQPVVWTRVAKIPDFVYFTHAAHLDRGVDCGRCHGPVDRMDRVAEAATFTMGFCVGCHREQRATHDCFTCHR